MDWQSLWARKHDDIIIAVLAGLAVIFVGWLCTKVFARWNRVPKPEQAKRPLPAITQHFSPTINNTIQIPVASVSPSASGANGRTVADRNTLAELQTLLPEQGGIARLRRQQFWHH